MSYLGLAGNEGMEQSMESIRLAYIGITIQVHSFIPRGKIWDRRIQFVDLLAGTGESGIRSFAAASVWLAGCGGC